MKTYIQWFFILGSAAFLSWYLPVALKDGTVTLSEIFVIVINALCIIINLAGYAESGGNKETDKSVRWDYAVDGRIVLVDRKGEFVAISRSPRDTDTDRLRRIAKALGYYPPDYDATPLA